MKKFLVVLFVVLASACSMPGIASHRAPQGSPAAVAPTVGLRDGGPEAPACAEKVIRAEASPNVPVAGAVACLDDFVQQALAAALRSPTGHATDAELAAFAATDPTFTHYASCGQNADDGYWYFDLSNPATGIHRAARVTTGPDGRVSSVQFATRAASASTCT